MRSGGTIRVVPGKDLTSSAASDLLRDAITAGPAVAIVEDDRLAQQKLGGIAPAESAVVVLTSGSTGTPKAVGISAPALVASATSSLARLGAAHGATWSLLLPLHHIAGVQVLIRALLSDAALGGVHDRVDFTAIVPTQLQRALSPNSGDPVLKKHLQGCRAVLVGGAPLADGLRAHAAAEGITTIATYGMTETSGGCVYDGIPLDGVTIEVAPDGRLIIDSPGNALGYLDDPIATKAHFLSTGFLTHDLGEVFDGHLRVLGRADAVINSGGEKISLDAVESSLRQHPAIIDAIAVGVPDSTWGERLVVGVVLREPLSLANLRDHVSIELNRMSAPQGMVVLSEIPTGALGKPHRAALLNFPLTEALS